MPAVELSELSDALNAAALLATLPYQAILPRKWRGKKMDSVAYPVVWEPLAASLLNVRRQLLLQQTTAFLWVKTTRVVTLTDNTTFLEAAPVQVGIVNQQSGISYTGGDDAHLENVSGPAAFPFTLPFPILLEPQANLNWDADNLSATAYNVRVELHGVRIYQTAA